MSNQRHRILLVEDNPADADLIKDELNAEGEASYSIEVSSRLKDGMERLAVQAFDLVLLDLSLPDCRGLETFLRVFRAHPDVPIVVVSGLDDLSLASDAVRSGAQDYIFKGELDSAMLNRAARFAIERHSRLRRLNPYLSSKSKAPGVNGAASVKHPTIAAQDPEVFATLTERFRRLVELSSRQRLFREVQNISGELHGLAMYLCMLQAGAEDAEAIYVGALEQLVGIVAHDQASAYMEEAQMLRAELYRYLTDFYRDATLGLPAKFAEKDAETGPGEGSKV